MTVHAAKAKVESSTVPAAISALDRTRLLLDNLNCTPVFRSVQTVQHLVCRDAGEATALLSVTWLVLGVVALLAFLALFLIWHALWVNRRRCMLRPGGSALKPKARSCCRKVPSTRLGSMRSSEQGSGKAPVGGVPAVSEGSRRGRPKPGDYSECSRSSRQGSLFEDESTSARFSSAQMLPVSVSGTRDSRGGDRYPAATNKLSPEGPNASGRQEQRRGRGGSSSSGINGAEGPEASTQEWRRESGSRRPFFPNLPRDERAEVDESMWAFPS